jgi:membrane-bound ClpP family serine protease
MGYWITSLALVGFGLVTGFSIGRPFFLIGAAMLVLGRLRHRALVFWPPFLGFVAYNIAFFAIAPFYCSAGGIVGGGMTTATCSSLVGIPWPDDPSGLNVSASAFDIANGVSLIIGVAIAALVYGGLRLDRERKASESRRATTGPMATPRIPGS